MKKSLFLVFIFPFTLCKAQLGHTKAETIDKYGYDYKSSIANDGTPYISYTKAAYSERSGNYYSSTTFYFSVSVSYCDMEVVIDPISEINSWINFFNQNFVKLGETTWKDYEKNILMSVRRDDSYMPSVVIVKYEYDTK